MATYLPETIQKYKEQILFEIVEQSENYIMPSSRDVGHLYKRAKKYFGSWENARIAANLNKRTKQKVNNIKKKNTIYMAVTPDKYEFPVYIEETVRELSKKTGASENNIYSSIAHKASGKVTGLKFLRVIL